jgi:hypothetical protein
MKFTDLTVFLNAIQSQSVVVQNNYLSRLMKHLAFGFTQRFAPRCFAKRLFYCLHASVLHTIVVSLHGLLGRKHRTHFTREQKATSVDLATGKATGTSVVNKASCISEQIRQTHLGLFCFSMLIGVNI